jgi:F-type H+-transporting ATPase subunit b
MFEDATFWIAVSFLLFIALLVYLKVPQRVTEVLDRRGAAIRREIDEARALREEAQSLLASYQRRRAEAEQETEEIIARAQTEATALAEEARRQMEFQVRRRTQLAEEKIAQAEAEAVKAVRNAAVDVATAAAERLIRERMDGEQARRLTEDSIRNLRLRLH